MISKISVCLLLVSKVPQDQAVLRLEEVYRERFPDRYYLMPFYQDTMANVLSVYSDSYSFQGAFPAVPRWIGERKYTHYLFCTSDFVLNSDINAVNIGACLKLQPGTAFLKNFAALNDGMTKGWQPAFQSLAVFLNHCYQTGRYVEYRDALPDREEAGRLLARHGVLTEPVTLKHLSQYQPDSRQECLNLFMAKLIQQVKTSDPVATYPLAYGDSRLLAVPAEALRMFCHYCGVFAALRLWAEVAVPTALLMSCSHVVTEAETGMNLSNEPTT